MPNPFRTLRFRLVLLNLAMFGTVIVLLGAVFLVAAERYLRREFDQRSIDGARVSLLVLARADAGLPLDSRTRVSINEVVTDAVERCHPYAQQREIRLEPALCAPTKELDEPEVEGDA
jgi:signal transduction histidine kinase